MEKLSLKAFNKVVELVIETPFRLNSIPYRGPARFAKSN